MCRLLESYTPEIVSVMDTVAIDSDSVRAGFGQLSHHFWFENVFFPRIEMLVFVIFSVRILISDL